MSKTIISHKQVKSVEQNSITYADNEGHEQVIDFEECYQNHLKRRLSPEAIENFKRFNQKTDADVPAHIERVKAWRTIADRNVIGYSFGNEGGLEYGAPYFEFYTEPRVRIEFENEDELRDMQSIIEREFRWLTYDVT